MPAPERPLRRSRCLPLLLAALLLCPAFLSLPAFTQSPDPVGLTRRAVDRMDDAKTAAHRFTDFDLAHNQNRNEKGKLYADSLDLYEDTWIADLPFKRLVAVNGDPLSGKDLAREQKRYDDAVHDRIALDDSARARLVHERFMDAGLDLDAVLTPTYRLQALRQETVAGRNALVIDAIPVQATASRPAAPIHYTLWISTEDPALLRFTFEATSNTPRLLQGSHGEKDFTLVEGTPLPSHSRMHGLVLVGQETITVDSEHTYSKYRRFTATTRMLPASDIPAGP